MKDITPVAAVGEAVAGEAAKTRSLLESLIANIDKSNFDVAELLYTVKRKGYYYPEFNTFKEYYKTLKIKPRKSQYLTRIFEVMDAVGIQREKFEPLGITRLREITSLDPDATWTNPQTGVEMPVKDFIIEFVNKGEEIDIEDLKQHIRTLKGLVGDDDLVWLNFCVKKSVAEETIKPALQLAKNFIGSVGKDEEGIAIDPSDGQALEAITADYLSDPANNVLPEEINDDDY